MITTQRPDDARSVTHGAGRAGCQREADQHRRTRTRTSGGCRQRGDERRRRRPGWRGRCTGDDDARATAGRRRLLQGQRREHARRTARAAPTATSPDPARRTFSTLRGRPLGPHRAAGVEPDERRPYDVGRCLAPCLEELRDHPRAPVRPPLRGLRGRRRLPALAGQDDHRVRRPPLLHDHHEPPPAAHQRLVRRARVAAGARTWWSATSCTRWCSA